MDEKTVAVIDRDNTSDIRVRLADFHGRRCVDIRVFAKGDGFHRVPAKKGIAVPLDCLPELIAALQMEDDDP